MIMTDDKSKSVQRKEGKPMYASRESPLHESVSAPTDTGGMKTGKPRSAPTSDD